MIGNNTITRPKIVVGNAVNYYGAPTVFGAVSIGQNTWTNVGQITITTRGGFVLVVANSGGNTFWVLVTFGITLRSGVMAAPLQGRVILLLLIHSFLWWGPSQRGIILRQEVTRMH